MKLYLKINEKGKISVVKRKPEGNFSIFVELVQSENNSEALRRAAHFCYYGVDYGKDS